MNAFRIFWLVLPLACASSSAPQVVTPSKSAAVQPAPAVATAAVEGRVASDVTSPVEGAVVALVPAREDWNRDREAPPGRMVTGPDGRFRFEGLAPGEYGLTVSSPRHEAAFILDVKLTAGAPARQVDVVLQPARHLVRGVVRTDAGKPAPAVWLSVGRQGDFKGDLLYVRTDAHGRFELSLPVGKYGVDAPAQGFWFVERKFDVRAEAPSDELDLTLRSLPETTPPAPEVVSWVKQALVPLSTVEAGNGFEDLRPMKPWLSKARVVSLGEATHGTREFYQLKHRMLEFLVTELGFTVLAVEDSFGDALTVNDYVLHGKGDAATALQSLSELMRTEEVLALIRWMRAYNADPRHTRKLKFYGVDMLGPDAPARAILDFFAQEDPTFHQRLVGSMTPFLDPRNRWVQQEEAAQVLEGLVGEIKVRLRRLPVRKGSAKAHALVTRHARVLGQFATRLAGPASRSEHRDRAMAENALWLLEQEGPDARMVLWAHNGHVAAAQERHFKPMGHHLREALGDQMYVFGLAFNQGVLRAMHESQVASKAPREFGEHPVRPAEEGWLEGPLVQARVPLFALDLRGLPAEGAAREFFTQARHMRNFGFTFHEKEELAPYKVAKEFDGLLFVERSSATVAMPPSPR